MYVWGLGSICHAVILRTGICALVYVCQDVIKGHDRQMKDDTMKYAAVMRLYFFNVLILAFKNKR